MHNLKNISHTIHASAFELPLTASCWNVATDSLICAFGPSKSCPVLTLRRLRPKLSPPLDPLATLGEGSTGEWQQIASWDVPCHSEEDSTEKVQDLHYFPDESTVCLVLSGGDLIVVREDATSDQDRIEIVGSVDVGITAATWSPDEEILIISTKADTILFMTRDFDCITDVTMGPQDLAVSKHVDVGWGKSETQFKGKRAKGLRDPTMPEKVDEGVLSDNDSGIVTISWRGDGAYVAVSTVESGKRRVIRVYSREATLDSVSEPVDGLEGALSWRPAGNLLAGVQRHRERIDVVFFERNGLRHGQFTLPLTIDDMKTFASDIRLDWNIDSTVLAVAFKDRVQLWTMGNYHYYLKKAIPIPAFHPQDSKPLSLTWHGESTLRLAVCSPDYVQLLDHAFMTAGGPTHPPYDFGSLAVIDGNWLKLTHLRVANIPPPMAHRELELPSNIVDVSWSQTGSRIAILTNDRVFVYSCPNKAPSDLQPEKLAEIELGDTTSDILLAQQVAIVGESDILASCTTISGAVLMRFCLHNEGPTLRRMGITKLLGVSRILAHSDHQSLCIDTHQGILMRSADMKDAWRHSSTAAREPLQWIEIVNLGEQKDTIVFGLSKSGHLYADDRMLANNCTSFLVSQSHLVFTSTQHLLKFVHMDRVQDLEVPLDEPERDERCRSIERGAKLVAIMPSGSSLTLQMPRGNLETIFPRALVVAGIRKSIMAKEYKAAFVACRNHRVDMNILYDHAPKQFMASIDLFLSQVKKVEHVDLFLSQLRNEDVSKSMYRETMPRKFISNGNPKSLEPGTVHSESGRGSVSKVNEICDAFIGALSSRTATKLQNLVTAHVCKTPPDLEAGLSLVGRLRRTSEDIAEKAVEHICFLADVNRLFDTALVLYDLDLALLVAQQSQKASRPAADPREYMPFLQGLHDMTPLRRRFAIEDHLGRYPKALHQLHELGAFDELKAYMTKHSLYKDALNIYRYQQDKLPELYNLYARALEERSAFKEAAILYEGLQQYGKATKDYQAAGCWEEALCCSSSAEMPESQQKELAQSLADNLVESKEYFHAATIQLEHLDDAESAARTLCKGYFFSKATRILGLRDRHDLVETIINQGLIDGFKSYTELLADCKGQVNAQVPRLRELRAKKTEDPLAYLEGVADVDVPDNVSLAATDTSTSASLFTRYTNRSNGTLNTQTTRKTSKNRRREERKRARGKKGSVYEEEYLVNSIARLIERIDGVRGEVGRLVEGLLRRNMRERAMAVERAMCEVVDLCLHSIGEVFEVVEPDSTDADAPRQEDRPAGADGVLWESIGETQKKRQAPKLRPFPRSALLGA
ncbi:MAG: hypothetical protein M1825_003377 [Sarcosagium campestre]|nr:MAG: hypothetical protein M1825_003377 [Sarcosagium campestre]